VHVEKIDESWSAKDVALALSSRSRLAWLDGDGTGRSGRWSFVGSDPDQVRAVHFYEEHATDPLEVLRGLSCARSPVAEMPTRVPEWIGFFAYDVGLRGRARVAASHTRDPNVPIAWWGRYDALFAIDQLTDVRYVVGDDAAACERLIARVAEGLANAPPVATMGAVVSEDGALHVKRVVAALHHIREGNIYQVNLARRFHAPYAGSPLALQLAMRDASAVPLGFYVDTGESCVISRTMECFLAWDGHRLVTRPIKGTIARSGAQDAVDATNLTKDDKERAEHSMIVDLMRNDLGRVAEAGSVVVRDLLTVEPYAALSHLVSTVECETRDDVSIEQILRATFPPGSVTGTPKVRAMQIIEELEPVARGVYTGAVGMIDRAGGFSLAVAIRTAVVHNDEVSYYAGGGIVSASDPVKELAETDLKARVFLDAAKKISPIL
jgi:para-aminobenzoate synthetase component 1